MGQLNRLVLIGFLVLLSVLLLFGCITPQTPPSTNQSQSTNFCAKQNCEWWQKCVESQKKCVALEGYCIEAKDCAPDEKCNLEKHLCTSKSENTSDSNGNGLSNGKQNVSALTKGAIAEAVKKGVVVISGDQSLGSGVILFNENSNVFILTNKHVVEDSYTPGYSQFNLQVKTLDGSYYAPDKVLISPHGIDLAILIVPDTDEKISKSAVKNRYTTKECEDVKPTELDDVIAVGNPNSLESSVTKGIVSATRPYFTEENYEYSTIQTDAAINPGNSGGGLFDLQSGCLIGINTFVYREDTSGTKLEGLNFAIDINNFNRYVDEEETWNELNKGTKSTTYECPQGYYVANDGYCYPIDGGGGSFGDSCPNGYVLGTDDLCHEECGTNTYCLGDAQCYNSQCLICPDGQYLGIDGYCYPENTDYYSCPDGYYLADNGYCYPNSGSGGSTCPSGYVYGTDGLCHEECGYNTYCTDGSQCYNGECLICPDGQYLGIDGYCYPESGGDANCPDGYYAATEDYCCQYGSYYGGDGYCYPE